jgi:hypothetical protein
MHLWRGQWSAVTWRAYLDAGVTGSELAAISRSTYSGRRWAHKSSPARWKKKPNPAWRLRNTGPERRSIRARPRRHFPLVLSRSLVLRAHSSSLCRCAAFPISATSPVPQPLFLFSRQLLPGSDQFLPCQNVPNRALYLVDSLLREFRNFLHQSPFSVCMVRSRRGQDGLVPITPLPRPPRGRGRRGAGA